MLLIVGVLWRLCGYVFAVMCRNFGCVCDVCCGKGVVMVVWCWCGFGHLIVILYMVHKCGFVLVVSVGSLRG